MRSSRRILSILALVLGAAALAGCSSRTMPGSMCWNDPFHPCTTNTPLCYGR